MKKLGSLLGTACFFKKRAAFLVIVAMIIIFLGCSENNIQGEVNELKDVKKDSELKEVTDDSAIMLDVNYTAGWLEIWDVYDISAALDPKSASALQKKSMDLRNEGKFEESLQEIDKALQLAPGKASIWFTKAKTLTMIGRFAEAEEALHKSLQLEENDEVWCLLGILKGYEGKLDESIQAFDKSISFKPTIQAWFGKGITYADQDKNTEAIKCFDNALQIDNRYPAVWYMKGVKLVEIDRYEEAKTSFKKAVDLGYVRGERALKILEKQGF